jgi:hypothetical protein
MPEIGCPRLAHFNQYSFIFGKIYGKVDYDSQAHPQMDRKVDLLSPSCAVQEAGGTIQ